MRLLFTFLLSSQIIFGQTWMQLADFPGLKRDDGVAVVVNNKAYVGTGLIEWALTVDFYVLDLTTYSWSSGSAMPNNAGRQYACAFSGNGCFYVFGGDGNNGALNDMYKYDVSSNSWITVASKPGNGLIAATCMNFGDKVIISGGKFQSGKVSAEVWEYTISTDSWIQKNNYPFAGRWRASATVFNNNGYMIFGRDTGGIFRREFYKYTPATDSWAKIMDFPAGTGRAYSSLNATYTKLCMFGGIDTLNNCYKDLWYFYEATSAWLQGPDIPSVARKGGMNFTYGNDLFYTCGISDGDVRLTETWKTDIPLGIKTNKTSAAILLYPNPTQGFVNFDMTSKTPGGLSCSYSDIYGNELAFFENLENNGRLDISSFKPGIYILKFYSEDKLIETKKIVKN